MSAKTLRLLVGMTGCSGAKNCIHCAAMAELTAIENAAQDLSDNGSDGAGVRTWELMDIITEECAQRAKESK